MGIINICASEKEAINSIDERELEKLIDQAKRNTSSGTLYGLPLASCGSYVATRLRHFETALDDCGKAKSSKKLEQTLYSLGRAGADLLFSVRAMKQRVETEEKERELFYIDDDIYCPHHFSPDLTVTVSYRWRKSVEDEWTRGIITFHHKSAARPGFSAQRPKRKLSAAKQAHKLQYELSGEWEHLRLNALCTLRDYLRDGGDGSMIPDSYQVRIDPRTGGLNNSSTRFWQNPLEV